MSKMNVEMQKLSRKSAFYFFASIGNYTGESATSIDARALLELQNCEVFHRIY